MKHKVFLIIFAFAGTLIANAQKLSSNPDTLRNQISIEVFGSSMKFSLGYERILINQPTYKLATRAGVGYYPFSDNLLSIPIELSTFWGSDRGFIEAGLGLTFCQYKTRRYPGGSLAFLSEEYYSNNKESKILPNLKFGYRYQKPNKKSSFQIALSFLFELTDNKMTLFWPQVPISIKYGYRF